MLLIFGKVMRVSENQHKILLSRHFPLPDCVAGSCCDIKRRLPT
jgi:hypothetical protein